MNETVQDLKKAIALFEKAFDAKCTCNSELSSDCQQCNLVIQARELYRPHIGATVTLKREA